MNRKVRFTLTSFFTVLALFFIGLQSLTVNAQQTKTQSKESKEQKEKEKQKTEIEKAHKAVAESPVGAMFLKILSQKDSDWQLIKGYYEFTKHRDDEPLRVSMKFEKGSDYIYVTISEFNSAEDAADAVFRMERTETSVPTKVSRDDRYGDYGVTVTGLYGSFEIRFRKGNFVVSVGGERKTADQFCSYALATVSKFAVN